MKTAKRMSRWKKILIWISVVAVVLVAGGFIFLASVTYSPSGQAKAAMQSDAKVLVTKIKQGYRFEPQGAEVVEPNIIFYPGGLVEPESYSPLARTMAEHGHRVYIAKMPLNLAIFGLNKADSFIAEHPDEAFVIGGHSLGGAFASRYAADNSGKLEGIFYFAAYADDGGSLSTTGLSALQITGTSDGVLNKEEWEKTKTNLPADTTFVSIEGGNHGQFGSYGMQKGDNVPEITGDEQLKDVVQALDDWFSTLNK
ncbi:Alpha/beta hydrolase family protein [compost metagenome]